MTIAVNIGTKLSCANSADPDQTALEEQSDQGMHCLTFYHDFQIFKRYKSIKV